MKRLFVREYLRKLGIVIVFFMTSFSFLFSQANGNLAPTFYLTELNGDDFFASRVFGEKATDPSVVVLSFFATWCIPCRAEAPQLELLSQEFPDVEFYLVSVKDPTDKILSWLNKFDIELPVLVDKYGRTAEKFEVIGNDTNNTAGKTLPTLFVINKSGRIVYEHSGYEKGDELELKKMLETLN